VPGRTWESGSKPPERSEHVFEEQDVDVEAAEERLGDGAVAAARVPLAGGVPAADVERRG